MYVMLKPDGAIYTTMDPDIRPALGQETYDLALASLKYSFQIHYERKLPFGLYQHAAQLPGGAYLTQYPDAEVKKMQVLTDFVKWIIDTYPDAWFVTNQQLLDWMKSPVPVEKMGAFLPCYLPATDKSNPEVCDGIDNDGDGTIDNGLLETCQFPSNSLKTCFGCPASIPSPGTPVPARSSNRALVPANGCPVPQTWDTASGKCVDLKRPLVKIADIPPNTVNPVVIDVNKGNSAIGLKALVTLSVTLLGLSLF